MGTGEAGRNEPVRKDNGGVEKGFEGVKRPPGRPPKRPEDRKTVAMNIPMTRDERKAVREAARRAGAKPVTWARDVLLRAAET